MNRYVQKKKKKIVHVVNVSEIVWFIFLRGRRETKILLSRRTADDDDDDDNSSKSYTGKSCQQENNGFYF